MENQPQINIDVNQTKELKCKQCQNNTFQQVFQLRLIPKLLVGASQDSLMPIPVFECSACGEILQESLPVELQQKSIQKS